MSELQAPIVNFQVRAGKSKAGFSGQRVLIIGHGNGTNANGNLITDIQPREVADLCGETSLSRLAYLRFRDYNRNTPVDIITIDPTGAAPESHSVLPVGTAKESKVVRISAFDNAFTARVHITIGDTATQIATKIKAELIRPGISKNLSINVTLPGSGGVELTPVFKDGAGCTGRIKVLDRLLGVVFTIIQPSAQTGSAGASGIFTQLTKRYQTIVFDEMTSFSAVDRYLSGLFNSSNTAKGGIGVTMAEGSVHGLRATFGVMNTKVMVVLANPSEMELSAIPLLAATEFAAKRSLRLTDGAVLGDIVVDAQESFGGVNKSSLPYHNTPMSYIAPDTSLDIDQVESLNDVGLSVIVPNGVDTVLGSVVTLYKKDGSGIEDKTFKYLNAVDTSLAIQEYLFNSCQKEFGQTRATGGDLVAGVSMTNAISVKAFIVGLYDDLVNMTLVQGGPDARKSFKRTLTVDLDPATGTYKIYAPTAIVSQLRGIDGIVAISYTF